MKAIDNEQDIERGISKPGKENKESEETKLNVDEKGNYEGYCAIATCCFCLIIAIVCICVSLQYNEPQENEMIRIEGTPMIAFGIGAMIIGCILFCMSAAACAHCCDVCLVLH